MRAFRQVDGFSGRQDAALYGRQGCLPPHFQTVSKRLKADYLILPGDMTHSARPEEVQIASEFIGKACAALSVNPNNIVFVPGNHDVDWSVFDKPDTTGFRRAQRYD